MIGKLIWRNLWRNKRRTLITTSSVTFAVVLAVVTQALVKGTFGNLIDSVVGGYSGHVQVHATGYWDEPSLELLMSDDDALRATLQAIPGVTAVVPRLETFMLVSADTLTRGALVMGVDGALEQHLMKLDDRIVRGAPVRNGDHGVVLAEGLAHRLAVDVHDTIVLLGQGYHGSMAAGKYPVRGIARFGAPQLNDGLVYLPLATAQELLSTPDMVTTWAFALDDPKAMEAVQAAVASTIGADRSTMTWKQMMPEVDSHIRSDQASTGIIIGVLYLVVAFGIFGTILMMLHERTYEFGMLLAVGMGRRLLALVIVIESVLLSLFGALMGVLLAWPLVWLMQERPIRLTGAMAEVYADYGFAPIMPAVLDPRIFLDQTLVVLAIALVLAIYPLRHVLKLLPLTAMNR
ncbi:MAG TPA: FtsX-like permease family protein [Flavobacteriales bacterium]|nr:FtsX-like permease family protein [Flavobacteriales bacterium]